MAATVAATLLCTMIVTLTSGVGSFTGITAGQADLAAATLAAPQPVLTTTCPPGGATTVDLSWAPVPGGGHYEITRTDSGVLGVTADQQFSDATAPGTRDVTYQITALNNTWRSPSGTVTAPACRTGPIDAAGTAPVAAYGLRLLTRTYDGPLVLVRRDTDDSVTDVGADVHGLLDTSALTAFCGTHTCTVTTWYDQSGNTRDAVQFNVGRQPVLVDAGTVQTFEGRPALRYDGTHGLLADPVPLGGDQITGNAVGEALLTGTADTGWVGHAGRLLGFRATGQARDWDNPTSVVPLNVYVGGVRSERGNQRHAPAPGTASGVLTATYDGTHNVVRRDGVPGAARPDSGPFADDGTLGIGASPDFDDIPGRLVGSVTEAMLFATALPQAQRWAMETDQLAYLGRPVPGLPGAPTGPTAEASNGATTVSWTAPTDGDPPVQYRVDVIGSDRGCLVDAATTTCRIAPLDNGTSYTVQVVAVTGAGESPPATVGVTLPARVAPLDLATTDPLAAYSLRRLDESWTGPVVRVRRTSDDAEADIATTTAGYLDMTTLTTFCGTDTCTVTTWYDQTGNDHHLLQPNTYRQPDLVQDGVLHTERDRIALHLNGYESLGRSGVPLAGTTLTAVASGTAHGTLGRMMSFIADGESIDTDNEASAALFFRDGNDLYAMRGDVRTSRVPRVFDGSVYSTVFDGSTNASHANGVRGTTAASTGSFGPTGRLWVGDRALYDRALFGDLHEVLLYDAALPDHERRALENDLMAYIGRPPGPTPPGEPTGVTAEAGDTTATITWTAPADDGGSTITGYTATATPGGATCSTTPPTTSCPLTDLTNGQSYDITVTATNAEGTGPPSAAAAVSPRIDGPLDEIGTAAVAAYGLRLLDGDHTGPVVQVRRAGDDTLQDIGTTATGLLDTTALTTFCGIDTCTVTTWFDQSGNDHHATQTDPTRQPVLVAAGSLQTFDGRPALRYDGDRSLLADAVDLTGDELTAVAAGRAVDSATTGRSGRFVAFRATGQTDDWDNPTSVVPLATEYLLGIRSERDGPGAFAPGGSSGVFSATFDGTQNIVRRNGTPGTATPSSGPFAADGTLALGAGANYGDIQGRLIGELAEVLLFTTALSDTERSDIEGNVIAYVDTP